MGIELASMGRATAATSSRLSSYSQVCLATAQALTSFSRATLLLVPWQAVRSDKNAGRVDVRNELFHQGAQVLDALLSALSHLPMKHGQFQRLAPWPFPAVPAPSSTILCSNMLAGGSAASSTMGSVVEHVETVIEASSIAALALELAIASAAAKTEKSVGLRASLYVPVWYIGMFLCVYSKFILSYWTYHA